jgi:hypothetical protein
MWYDGAIMMVRTQITLDSEMQKRARRRASDLGVSLAEYLRQLVERDLGRPEVRPDVSAIFNLGSSGGSNIARNKDLMIGEAFDQARSKRRRSA